MEQDLVIFFKNKRGDFPILNQKINDYPLIYADNSATTQKPEQVIDAITHFYKNYCSNVHRGIHKLSQIATEEFEKARFKVAELINCDENEIVFTKGATNSLNIISNSYYDIIDKDDEIITSDMEHHSNLVIWQELAKRKNAKLKIVKMNKDFTIDINDLKKNITDKTKIISITHISNVLGSINPIEEVGEIAIKNNIKFIVDASQSIGHMPIDVKKIKCDYLVFSSHKMCGPSGVGVLYVKKDNYKYLKPLEFGSSMIDEVDFFDSTYQKGYFKLESGTPNIEGIIGLGFAVDYLRSIGLEKIEEYEKILVDYFISNFKKLKNFKLHGNLSNQRSAIFSLTHKTLHAHDLSSIFNAFGIAIRGGHHCAMPLIKKLNVNSTSRFSFYFYNTKQEIDFIFKVLKDIDDDKINLKDYI